MKILIVGNSQAGALKRAIGTKRRYAGCDFDVHLLAGGLGPHLKVENGRLYPEVVRNRFFCTVPDADAAGVDLSGYDGVLYASAGLTSHRKTSRWALLNQLMLSSMAKKPYRGHQMVSEEVMAQSVENALYVTPGFKGVGLIRSIYDGPIVIMTWPLPARHFDKPENGSDLPKQYGKKVGEFLSWYYRAQIRALNKYAETIDARVLPPPRAILEAGFTPEEYAGPEAWHMNKEYGEMMLTRAVRMFKNYRREDKAA